MIMELPGPVVLYDGVCGIWYAPLQGETAAALRAAHPQIPQTLESVVLVDRGRVHLRSKAFLYGARYLTRPWRWAYHLRWIPALVLDLLYRVIARVRYRVWGKLDACTLPTADERAHLLP
jgi:predicted DCC family thiol-disulfide oxidoreductase YuxK